MRLSSARVPGTATTPHERSSIGHRSFVILSSLAEAMTTQIFPTTIGSRKGE